MRNFSGTASRIIDALINKAVIMLFCILLFDVWFAILDRYIFKMQIIWVEEAARYLMIWTMLLSIATAAYRKQHVYIAYLHDKLSERHRQHLILFLDSISIIICFAIAFLAFDFAMNGLYVRTSIFNMPIAVPNFAVCVSFFLTGIQILLVAIRDFGRPPNFVINENLSD